MAVIDAGAGLDCLFSLARVLAMYSGRLPLKVIEAAVELEDLFVLVEVPEPCFAKLLVLVTAGAALRMERSNVLARAHVLRSPRPLKPVVEM